VQFDESRNRDYYGLRELKYYKDVLRDFFSYYRKFSYEVDVIDPFTGSVIDKDYYPERIDSSSAVTIAAPLLRRVNCARYLSNLDLVNFVTACEFSCRYLDEYRVPKSMLDDDC
jgi:hypothetical protein